MLELLRETAFIIGTGVYGVYMLSTIVLQQRVQHPPWIDKAWTWTERPALAHLLYFPVYLILKFGHLGPLDILYFALGIITWYLTRNVGDDDTTKKMKDRVTAVVRVFEGRLVVVPKSA